MRLPCFTPVGEDVPKPTSFTRVGDDQGTYLLEEKGRERDFVQLLIVLDACFIDAKFNMVPG